MATPILYLDADDEITTAAARIRSTEADRLALVLPYGSRLATSRINFRLLAREAAERGKTIEIVAADPSARALATTAGLTVHPSVAAFEAGAAGADGGAGAAVMGAATAGEAAVDAATMAVVVPERGKVVRIDPPPDDAPTGVIIVPRQSSERVPVVGRVKPPVRTGAAVGAGVAILAVVVVAGILAFLLLPSATIVLAPRSTEVGPLAASVDARPDVTAPDATTMQIPSKSYPFGAEASGTFTTAGKKVTDTAATGMVTFANYDTGGGNTIPSGAIVKTESGIAFRTLDTATMPPANVQFIFPNFVVVPSTSSVPVEAVVNGASGNVAAKTIVVVPKGENKNLTKVTNQDATSGGTHTEGPQVSQADVNSAMAKLTTQLSADFDAKIQAALGVPAGTTLFPETKSLGIVTPSVVPKTLVGQEVPTFDLAVTAAGTVVGVDASPVKTVAEARLRSRVDPGSTLDAASITIDIGTPTVTGDTVTFPVTMHGTEVKTVDRATLLASIKGLDLPAARSKLAPYGDVDIRVWPDWVTAIPTNLDRITLTIGDPRPAPSPTP